MHIITMYVHARLVYITIFVQPTKKRRKERKTKNKIFLCLFCALKQKKKYGSSYLMFQQLYAISPRIIAPLRRLLGTVNATKLVSRDARGQPKGIETALGLSHCYQTAPAREIQVAPAFGVYDVAQRVEIYLDTITYFAMVYTTYMQKQLISITGGEQQFINNFSKLAAS